MSVILIMLPVALALAAAGVGAFIWAARRGQFEDLDTPPVRAVFDQETPSPARQGSDFPCKTEHDATR
ncbi:MAG: cbb3-type cytochrome oxidase assembly protein CcoS [Phycisphaerales bacterium]